MGNPYEDARRAGAQALLDEWAAAVRTGDTDSLPALFDPNAEPGFLESEIRRANNAAGVPFGEFAYDIGVEPETPVASATADELGASDVWAPTVYLRYSIAGADARSTRKPVALLLARHGDEWKLVSDSGVPGSDRETWRGPWDFGPVTVRRVDGEEGRPSFVLGPTTQAPMIDLLASEVGDAVGHVTDVWVRTGRAGPWSWSRVRRRSSPRSSAVITAGRTSLRSPCPTRSTGARGRRPVSASCSARSRRGD